MTDEATEIILQQIDFLQSQAKRILNDLRDTRIEIERLIQIVKKR